MALTRAFNFAINWLRKFRKLGVKSIEIRTTLIKTITSSQQQIFLANFVILDGQIVLLRKIIRLHIQMCFLPFEIAKENSKA
jgi:hypothetical protein